MRFLVNVSGMGQELDLSITCTLRYHHVLLQRLLITTGIYIEVIQPSATIGLTCPNNSILVVLRQLGRSKTIKRVESNCMLLSPESWTWLTIRTPDTVEVLDQEEEEHLEEVIKVKERVVEMENPHLGLKVVKHLSIVYSQRGVSSTCTFPDDSLT